MCTHCEEGICTSGCTTGKKPPNYDLQLISLETQLATVRTNIRTVAEYQRFHRLVKEFFEDPAMVLAVNQPSGAKAYIDPKGEEDENPTHARVYFNNRQAISVAQAQCADVEVV